MSITLTQEDEDVLQSVADIAAKSGMSYTEIINYLESGPLHQAHLAVHEKEKGPCNFMEFDEAYKKRLKEIMCPTSLTAEAIEELAKKHGIK
jgi:hypothetical protein